METKEMMNKILKCLYVIIILLALNTIITIVVNGTVNNSTEKSETEGTSSEDYDVSMFTSIDADGVVDAFKSKDLKVIYMFNFCQIYKKPKKNMIMKHYI